MSCEPDLPQPCFLRPALCGAPVNVGSRFLLGLKSSWETHGIFFWSAIRRKNTNQEDCITFSAHLEGSLPTHCFDVLFRWLWVPREPCSDTCTSLANAQLSTEMNGSTSHDDTNNHWSLCISWARLWCWTLLSFLNAVLSCPVWSQAPSCAALLTCTVALTRVHALVTLPGYEGISETQCVSEDMVSNGTDENGFFQNSAFDHCLNHIPSIYTDT